MVMDSMKKRSLFQRPLFVLSMVLFLLPEAACFTPSYNAWQQARMRCHSHTNGGGKTLHMQSPSPGRKVLVAGLQRSVLDPGAALRGFFEAAGLQVDGVECFRDGRNYAFVTLGTEEEAAAALAVPPAADIFLEVRPAVSRAARPQRRTLESQACFGAGRTPAGDGKVEVIMDGIRDPANLGSIYRLLATFGVSELTHVHADGSPEPLWEDDPHRWRRVQAVARGCERHTVRGFKRRSELVAWLRGEGEGEGAGEGAERCAVVAIETASGAESLHDFRFPERCAILVGAEGRGIDARVAKALRPGVDAFVVIPMSGPHVSLNVASALGIALYEYRRQWPGGAAGPQPPS